LFNVSVTDGENTAKGGKSEQRVQFGNAKSGFACMRVDRASSVTVDAGSPENSDIAGTCEPLVSIGHVNGSIKDRGGVDVGVKAGGVSN
jgi:hypothetical protein